jgi:hypothetical protein
LEHRRTIAAAIVPTDVGRREIVAIRHRKARKDGGLKNISKNLRQEPST